MLFSTAEWKRNQSKQVRSECDVNIFIYDKNGNNIAIYDKTTLKDFSYEASGSISNDTLPIFRISFSVIKSNEIIYDLPEDIYAEVSFGYYLPNSPNADINGWEWVYYEARYKIVSKEVPANGLVAKYTMKTIVDIGYYSRKFVDTDSQFDKGSSYLTLNGGRIDGASLGTYTNIIRLNAGNISNSILNYPLGKTLGVVSYLELARQLAVVAGRTLTIRDNYLTLLDVFDEGLVNYGIKKINLLEKPEISRNKKYNSIIINCYTDVENVDVLQVEEIERVFSQYDDTLYLEAGKYYQFKYIIGEQIYDIAYIVDSKITLSNYGNVWLKIYKFSTSVSKYFVHDITPPERSVGNDESSNSTLTISTPLMTKEHAPSSGHLLAMANNHLTKITLKCRIDPTLELFDKIWYENDDGSSTYGIVESIRYSFNGGFKGEIIIREIDANTIPLTIINEGDTDAQITITNTGTTRNIQFSQDGDIWFSDYLADGDTEIIGIPSGHSVSFRGENHSGLNISSSNLLKIGWTVNKYLIKGRIMSLIDPNFEYSIPNTYCFEKLFEGNIPPIEIDESIFKGTGNILGYAFDNLFHNGSSLSFTNDRKPYKFVLDCEEIGYDGFYNAFMGATLTAPLTFELTSITSLGFGSLNVGDYVYNLLTTGSYVNIIIPTTLATLSNNWAMGRRLNLYFKHTNEDDVLFNTANIIAQASDQKNSKIFNIYTDNDEIATACSDKRNEYTTVNLFYYDGTSREQPQLPAPTIERSSREVMHIDADEDANRFVLRGLTYTGDPLTIYTTDVNIPQITQVSGVRSISVKAYGTNYYPSDYSNTLQYYFDILDPDYYGWYDPTVPTIYWDSDDLISWDITGEYTVHIQIGNDFYENGMGGSFDPISAYVSTKDNVEVDVKMSKKSDIYCSAYSNALKMYVNRQIGNRAVLYSSPTISLSGTTLTITASQDAPNDMQDYLIIAMSGGQPYYFFANGTGTFTVDIGTLNVPHFTDITVRGYALINGTHCCTQESNSVHYGV